MYYIIGAIIILILSVFVMVYLYKKTSIIKIKNKYLRIILRLFLVLLPFICFGFTNGIVVVIHFATFFFIFDLLNIIFKKKYTLIFNCLAIIVSVIYLSIGLYQGYHIYETIYDVYTSKDIGVDNFKIIQISDSHTGVTFDGDEFKKIISDINKKNPDLLVITGDLVDDSTTHEDMIKTCEAFSLIHPTYGIYYVFGNHDKGYYANNYTESELRNNLISNNVIILEDEIVNITDRIVLIGRQDKDVPSRASIYELTKNIDSDKYIIDLNHQPNDYDNESKSSVDLVLSGHSHGGQIFPLGPIGKLIHANDEYKGMKMINNTTFIVNTGISSWSIKFKTFTKSEYTIINIRSNK